MWTATAFRVFNLWNEIHSETQRHCTLCKRPQFAERLPRDTGTTSYTEFDLVA